MRHRDLLTDAILHKQMRLIFILAILISFASAAQTENNIILKAQKLITDKKYDDAFSLLDSFDKENTKPNIVLLKEDIALDYFVSNLMYQTFAFKNINKDEDIMDYRGKEGTFSMYHFPLNEILDSLINVFPDNYNLYQGLGKYYYEVHLKYGEQLGKNTEQLFDLMESSFKKAVEHNAGDYLSYYVLGYVYLNRKKYEESIAHFLKSIELNKEFTTSYYNAAYAYLYKDDHANALKYAKISLGNYKDAEYKGDAARMIAVIYSEMKDEKREIEYYELSNRIDSNNYYTLKPLLKLYVKTDNLLSSKVLNAFFNLDPENPTIYNDLTDIYFRCEKPDLLKNFFQSKIKEQDSNKIVLGNLYFYLGEIFFANDKVAAKENFLKAKVVFAKVHEKDHKVFTAIDNALKQLEK